MTATGSGFLIPRPPLVAPNATVDAQPVTASLVIGDYGKNITNTASAATATLTLPAAKDVAGLSFRIYQTVAQITRLKPATGEKIFLGGSGVADKYVEVPAAIGNYCDVYCDGVQHHVISWSGALVKQA